jgi:hypothetical protein
VYHLHGHLQSLCPCQIRLALVKCQKDLGIEEKGSTGNLEQVDRPCADPGCVRGGRLPSSIHPAVHIEKQRYRLTKRLSMASIHRLPGSILG